MDWPQFLLILKQYGPLVAGFLFLLFWTTKRIDNLLDRNAQIYEGHIQHLWETQQRLLVALLGEQGSSQTSPTLDELKQKALTKGSGSKPLEDGAQK